MEKERPKITDEFRNPDGTFKHGNPGGGRPKGKTLKEFAREFLMTKTDEEKQDFLNSLDPSVVWRMAEGNPHNSSDVTSGGKPIPILNVHRDNSNTENNETQEEN